MIAVVTAIMTLIVYPFGPTITIPFLHWTFPLVIARFDVALLYVLALHHRCLRDCAGWLVVE